jgi:hypothetical protein
MSRFDPAESTLSDPVRKIKEAPRFEPCRESAHSQSALFARSDPLGSAEGNSVGRGLRVHASG